jgi:hypothetical protein
MHVCPVGFGPRVDVERESPFLPAEPRKLMETNQINSVPMIAGSTRNEGGSMVRSKSVNYLLPLTTFFDLSVWENTTFLVSF